MEGQIVFFYLFVQKGAMDTEQIRCTGLVVIGSHQSILDCLFLGLCLDCFDRGTTHLRLTEALHVIGKIIKMNCISLYIGEGAFQNV